MLSGDTVFLLDVDDTLLDNDHVIADLMHHIEQAIGPEPQKRYWQIFEEIRTELGYADYLGALQRYRVEHPRDSHILTVSHYLLNYPFATRLFPEALDVVEHCRTYGTCVILTDGDVIFQPRKIEGSGLAEAFDGKVLIYIHKELELDDIRERFPADHYVLIDDKVRILAATKRAWGAGVTTIFPRQGHYAHDEREVAKYPTPDLTVDRIGQLLGHAPAALVTAARG